MEDGKVRIPDGYLVVPIFDADTPVRLCVLVRREPDDVGGKLVVLRHNTDATVHLGCVTDADGCVHQWVELWVQKTDGRGVGNAMIDERWERLAAALTAVDEEQVWLTGFERQSGPVIYLDADACEPVQPESDGQRWALCRDEAVLASAGLPPYGSSPHRYLFQPDRGGGDGGFVPVSAGAPTNDRTTSLDIDGGLIPFNPAGGRLLARRYGHLTIEAYIDVLSGGSWHGQTGASSREGALPWASRPIPGWGDEQDPSGFADGLFLARHGRWGRLVEALHLKLKVLADAVGSVRSAVRELDRPMLSLSPESFQMNLCDVGSALPAHWAARVALCEAGNAREIRVGRGDARYFTLGGADGEEGELGDGRRSIYWPAAVGQPVRGRCSVRIRQVADVDEGLVAVEGTISTQDDLRATRGDLVHLSLPMGDGLDLYGHVEADRALAAGEYRFRSVAQRLDAGPMEALQRAEGVPLPDVTFEVVPVLGTPCDLYALGVLAVRALLVDGDTTLAVALDEILSLAREVGANPERIREVVASDGRWVRSLGPHRLVRDEIEPDGALDLVPAELWWDVIGLIVRCFEGVYPGAERPNLAGVGAPQLVFEPIEAGLRRLLTRTRSLVVIDWRYNREVSAVIRSTLLGMGG